MNKWIATGRTTDNVELLYTQDQLAVGRFSFAVDEGFGDKKKTHFFNCTVFGKTAEALEKHAPKGTKIAVEGRPQQDSWTDKEGHKRTAVKFVIDSWEFAQSAPEKPAETPNTTPETAPDGFMSLPDGIDDENLPFN